MTDLEAPGVELVRAARAGDVDAFAELVRRERPTLVMAGRALTGDTHEGEDAAQEALVTAFARLRTLRDPRSFGPWLSRILTRFALARRRRLRRTTGRADLGGVPDSRPAEDPRLAALRREVDRLPDKYRTLVSLFHLRGHGYRDVAEATGLTEKRVKSRLYQARELLRRRLGDERE
jgi:RNA polymerase sigma-70 factor (ECF subfamily)